MDDYSDFTKLVLARMESNPEEFEATGRWDNLVRGLEEYARSETDGRYAKTLWALEHQEIEVLLAKYRRMYLDRLHKELLKNIVSGNDKRDMLGTAFPSGLVKQQGQHPGAILTTGHISDSNSYAFAGSSITDHTDSFSYAPVKGEGQQVKFAEPPKPKKILITPTDVRMSARFGMTVEDYMNRRDGK